MAMNAKKVLEIYGFLFSRGLEDGQPPSPLSKRAFYCGMVAAFDQLAMAAAGMPFDVTSNEIAGECLQCAGQDDEEERRFVHVIETFYDSLEEDLCQQVEARQSP